MIKKWTWNAVETWFHIHLQKMDMFNFFTRLVLQKMDMGMIYIPNFETNSSFSCYFYVVRICLNTKWSFLCFSNYTEKFWATFWHYKYGNCYVFNSGLTSSAGTTKSVLKSNKAGPSHGEFFFWLIKLFNNASG